MGRVVHFEVHAEDPERAIRFYSTLFGWAFSKWDSPMEYWLINTGDCQTGINGGLVRRRGPAPADGQAVNAFVCTIDSPSVDDDSRKIAAAGGSLTVPKMAIVGVGWLAFAKDTEANIFGIMQRDPGAQ